MDLLTEVVERAFPSVTGVTYECKNTRSTNASAIGP